MFCYRHTARGSADDIVGEATDDANALQCCLAVKDTLCIRVCGGHDANNVVNSSVFT